MASREKPQSPAGSIYFDLRAPPPAKYRDGYIADVIRLGIGTPGNVDPEDPRVGAGIYVHEGKVVEKPHRDAPAVPQASVSAAPSPTSSARSVQETSPVSSPRSCSESSWSALRGAALASTMVGPVCSAPQPGQLRVPPPDPPSNHTTNTKFFVRDRALTDKERAPVITIGRFSDILAADRQPYYFSYCVEVVLYPENSSDPVEVIADDGTVKVVIYLLRLDTGGAADSWVFGNLPWEEFVKLSRKHKYTDQQLQTEYDKKNQMVFPEYIILPEDKAEVVYGFENAPHCVWVKQGICTLVLKQWGRPVSVPNFPIGVAYGAHDEHIMAPFDGLMGLGRAALPYSQVPASARYGPSVLFQDALHKRGLVKSTNFWVHITHPTWDLSGRDFMCFGDYHNPHSTTIPTWTEVDCIALSALWEVFLSRIIVYDGQTCILDHTFREGGVQTAVDTGAMQTYLPDDFVSLVEGKFSRAFTTPAGYASYSCTKSLVIRFYFGAKGEQFIDGQAVRFFLSPNYVPGEHPALDVKRSDRALLGLNFFRTFIVGFKDDETRPQLRLAKHPDVLPNQPYVSACKDQINLAATQPQRASGLAQDQRTGSTSTRIHISESNPSQAAPSPGVKPHARSGAQVHPRPEGQERSSAPQNPPRRQEQRPSTESATLPRERRVSRTQLPQDPGASGHDPGSSGAHRAGAPLAPDPYAPRAQPLAHDRYAAPQPHQHQPYVPSFPPTEQATRERRSSRAPPPDEIYIPPLPDQIENETSQPNPSSAEGPWHPRNFVQPRVGVTRPAPQNPAFNTQPYAPGPGPQRPPAQYQAPAAGHAPVVPPGSSVQASSSQRSRKTSVGAAFMNMFSKR